MLTFIEDGSIAYKLCFRESKTPEPRELEDGSLAKSDVPNPSWSFLQIDHAPSFDHDD